MNNPFNRCFFDELKALTPIFHLLEYRYEDDYRYNGHSPLKKIGFNSFNIYPISHSASTESGGGSFYRGGAILIMLYRPLGRMNGYIRVNFQPYSGYCFLNFGHDGYATSNSYDITLINIEKFLIKLDESCIENIRDFIDFYTEFFKEFKM